ncbi:NAD(P)H-binding protein [Leifsonia sp. fls2-241-R2A-40a]|uniref:SDR family oxidoreductase n=1 Tax=Leifsonia sp. fls2-241-R2A-40a TaxID=3040290 RepID=UPI00254CBAC2|nr:NAD(P)H-binding protein [Leifsonia sp. fls2-241-R2A-40a]
MNETIVVTGGTGRIGRSVVPRLVAAGHDVRVLSRHPLPASGDARVRQVVGDTVKGVGLDAAFADAGTVLHLAGGARGDDRAADTVAEAARRAGTAHLILISVVGAGRMPIGYFRAKATAERAVEASGVPWSILAVSQLHEFVLPLVRGLSRLPLTPAPGGLRFEPVHREEVAERLASLALSEPAGRVPDLAGPEVLDLVELVRRYSGRRRPTLPVRLPGAVGRAYRAGDNLADASAQRGVRTWDEFLRESADGPVVPGGSSALR